MNSHIAIVEVEKEEDKRGYEANNSQDEIGDCHEEALATYPGRVGEYEKLSSPKAPHRVSLSWPNQMRIKHSGTWDEICSTYWSQSQQSSRLWANGTCGSSLISNACPSPAWFDCLESCLSVFVSVGSRKSFPNIWANLTCRSGASSDARVSSSPPAWCVRRVS